MLANWAFCNLVLIFAVGGWVLARTLQFFADGWTLRPRTDLLDEHGRKRRRQEFLIVLLGTYVTIAASFALAIWKQH
jgi:hypothetical protein